MPTRTVSPSIAANLDAIERAAITLAIKPESFDARDLASRQNRVQFVSLLYDRARALIGWHVVVVPQLSATNLNLAIPPYTNVQHHGQARHFDGNVQWRSGVRRFVTYQRDFRGQWQLHLQGASGKPYHCACHDSSGMPLRSPAPRTPQSCAPSA